MTTNETNDRNNESNDSNHGNLGTATPGNTVPAFSEETVDTSTTSDAITKHSGLGIAATILGAILAILVIVASTLFISHSDAFLTFQDTTIDPENLTAEQQEHLGIVLLIGLMGVLAFILMVISFILALIGLLKAGRKKTFPVIGLILSVSPIILYIATAIFNM